MRKFDLSLRSSRSSYFATFRHQLTILSKTDALDEEKWLNMLGTFVKDWFRYESHFVHGRDSLVDIERTIKKPPRFGGMKTYNWEGVNPDGYFLDKLEPIPSALPSFQKLFQVSATALSIP